MEVPRSLSVVSRPSDEVCQVSVRGECVPGECEGSVCQVSVRGECVPGGCEGSGCQVSVRGVCAK